MLLNKGMKTFKDWMQLKEMGGAAPGIIGNKVPKDVQANANVWGAQPNGKPYPQKMKKQKK